MTGMKTRADKKTSIRMFGRSLGIVAALMATNVGAAEFQWASSQDAVTLDPHTINHSFVLGFIGNVYEPLVRRDTDFALEPALATGWEQTGDTTWRFALRQNVTFANGSAFSAEDVVFSFERAKKGGIKNLIATIDSVKAIDDHTVEITTKGINPILPREITTVYMMDRSWAEENNATEPSQPNSTEGNYATSSTMGTGPFQIAIRELGVKTVFEPNPTWWGDVNHNLTKATFNRIENAATRIAALTAGEIDMVQGISPQDVSRIEASPDLKMIIGPELRTMFLMLDVSRDALLESDVTDANPFKELKVRQAIQHAINREAIQQKVMRGYSVLTGSMLSKEINGYSPKLDVLPEYDVEKARALMKEAGYEDGFSVTLDCTNDRYMQDEALCIALGSMMTQIGIRVTVRAQTVGKWAEQVNPPTYNTSFTMVGYSPSSADAHNVLTTLVATRDPDRSMGVFNIGGYSNPKVDDLTAAIQIETNPTKRNDLILQAFRLIGEDAAYVPLQQLVLLWAAGKNVDLVQMPDDRLMLSHVTVN